MTNILHRVGITAPLDEVYAALTTTDGLAHWWAVNTQGKTDVDGVIEFRFDNGGIDVRVRELSPGRRVVWEVVAGPGEWIGTTVTFDLRREDDHTIVLFAHEGWAEPVEFMYHCSTKWAAFLLSLKAYAETGTGAPEPRDLKIGNW